MLLLLCLITLGAQISFASEVNQILITNLGFGSHLKNTWEIARAISDEPEYNVTMLTSRDYKLDFEETESLHFIRLDNIKEEDALLYLEEIVDPIDFVEGWNNYLKNEIFLNETVWNSLVERNFNMQFQEVSYVDYLISRELNLTVVHMLLFAPSPDTSML